MKYSAFYVGDGLYSVPIHETEELARIPKITPVPTVDERVAGLVNLRGKVAVALNLRACLEGGQTRSGSRGEAPEAGQRHMIIMESGKGSEDGSRPEQLEDPVVLIVDRIHGIVDDEGMEIQAPPAHVRKPFINGIIQSRDKLIVVLSVAKLVNEILKAGA